MTRKFQRNLAVAVLTHNSARFLDSLISSVRNQTCTPAVLFAVDNDSEDDTVERLNALGVSVVRQNNLGVGAGHTRSLLNAFENAAIEHVLLVEHDAFLAASCVERLHEAIDNLALTGAPFGALACRCVHPDEDAETVAAADRGELELGLTPATRLTFNGLLLSWHTVAAAGFPRSDFFIGQEDSDYFRRLKRMGLPTYLVGGAVIAHHGKGRTRRGEVEPLVRRSYSTRNSTYRDAIDGHWMRAVLRIAGYRTRSFFRSGTDDRALARAAVDGLSGRLGPLRDQPPEGRDA